MHSFTSDSVLPMICCTGLHAQEYWFAKGEQQLSNPACACILVYKVCECRQTLQLPNALFNLGVRSAERVH